MSESHRALARDVLAAALAAVAPEAALRRHVRLEGAWLIVDDTGFSTSDGSGACAQSARARRAAPWPRRSKTCWASASTRALVIVKDGHTGPDPAHPGARGRSIPYPTHAAWRPPQGCWPCCADSQADDLLLVLLSGGGSALLEQPAAGVDLAALQATTDLLLRAGAGIAEVNAVRKHLSVVKGGGLAHLASPATVLVLAISDVLGDPLDVIASGPFAPDPTTFAVPAPCSPATTCGRSSPPPWRVSCARAWTAA